MSTRTSRRPAGKTWSCQVQGCPQRGEKVPVDGDFGTFREHYMREHYREMTPEEVDALRAARPITRGDIR